MSPVRACPKCGAVPRACRCRPAAAGERRAYSDTAAYRAMRAAVLETYGQDCVYCHDPIDLELAHPDPYSLALAHVTAHADRGPFVLENVRPSHLACNRAAGRRPITGGPAHG